MIRIVFLVFPRAVENTCRSEIQYIYMTRYENKFYATVARRPGGCVEALMYA